MGELVLETKPTTPVYQVGDWVIWNSQFDYLSKLNPFQIVGINDDGTCELDIIYHSVPIDSVMSINMRVLSLHQPWASLVALGWKKYETRSWLTHYRGRLLIHAAKRPVDEMGKSLLEQVRDCGINLEISELPLGAIVADSELKDCLRIEENWRRISRFEQLCGNYQTGRFAWELKNTKLIDPPIAARGAQGLWIPTQDLRQQLTKEDLCRK